MMRLLYNDRNTLSRRTKNILSCLWNNDIWLLENDDWLIDPGAELVMNDCSHLQFIGTDDGKEIDKNYWYGEHKEVDADVDFLDYLKKTLGDDYVCFIQYSGAPAMGCGYIIFKFTEGT